MLTLQRSAGGRAGYASHHQDGWARARPLVVKVAAAVLPLPPPPPRISSPASNTATPSPAAVPSPACPAPKPGLAQLPPSESGCPPAPIQPPTVHSHSLPTPPIYSEDHPHARGSSVHIPPSPPSSSSTSAPVHDQTSPRRSATSSRRISDTTHSSHKRLALLELLNRTYTMTVRRKCTISHRPPRPTRPAAKLRAHQSSTSTTTASSSSAAHHNRSSSHSTLPASHPASLTPPDMDPRGVLGQYLQLEEGEEGEEPGIQDDAGIQDDWDTPNKGPGMLHEEEDQAALRAAGEADAGAAPPAQTPLGTAARSRLNAKATAGRRPGPSPGPGWEDTAAFYARAAAMFDRTVEKIGRGWALAGRAGGGGDGEAEGGSGGDGGSSAPAEWRQPPSAVMIHDVMEAAGSEEELRALMAKVPAAQEPLVLNMALPLLGRSRHLDQLQRLLRLMRGEGRCNAHTPAMAFLAFNEAGRMDLVLGHFEDMMRQGHDIGPIGASALIKICSQHRDLPLALELFSHMRRAGVSLNRFSFNCLAHLAGVMGSLKVALGVYRAMRGSKDPELQPDAYTYGALVHALISSQQWGLLPQVAQAVVASGVAVGPKLWAQLIMGAGRAQRPEWARQFFDAAVASGVHPSQPMYNALMGAAARGSGSLSHVMALYRHITACGMVPDAYTFNAILTAASRVGADLASVETVAHEMAVRWRLPLNTYLGTSLINAYRRTPELASPERRQVVVVLQRATAVLQTLKRERLANRQTYACIMRLFVQAGDLVSVQRLLQEMHLLGLPPDSTTMAALHMACEGAGFVPHAERFKAMAEELRQEEQQRQLAMGLAPPPAPGPWHRIKSFTAPLRTNTNTKHMLRLARAGPAAATAAAVKGRPAKKKGRQQAAGLAAPAVAAAGPGACGAPPVTRAKSPPRPSSGAAQATATTASTTPPPVQLKRA